MSSRHALVVSYLALFVALGGTAAALQGRFSVKADDLATDSVGLRALNQRAVGSLEIRPRAVLRRHLATAAVNRAKLAEGSVTSAAIRDRTISSFDLGVQRRIRFPENQSVVAASGLLAVTDRLAVSATRTGRPPIVLETPPGGGGRILLDGSTGTASGLLQMIETEGVPNLFPDSAALYARDDGNGRTELVAAFPGNEEWVLATSP